jgi:hypothetical protein
MQAGPDAIVGATVADPVRGLYGTPDFLIRSDRLASLYDLSPAFVAAFGEPWSAVQLDGPTHYVSLDVRFATLAVGAKGRMTAAERPHDQAAAIIHAWALGAMQGIEPAVSVLVGRVVKSDKAGRSEGGLDWPALVDPQSEPLRTKIEAAIAWRKDLRANGHGWKAEDLKVTKVDEGRWHTATASLLTPTSPPSLPVLQPGEWQEPAEVEFFVDFETFNNLDDDFGTFPAVGGQSLLFMIGCLHDDNFRCFIAESVTPADEAKIVDEWFAHMAEVADGRPYRVIHWSNAEPQFFRHNYDSVTSRHGDTRWSDPPWFDFCAELRRVRKNGNGLKEVGRHLYRQGEIQTDWDDDGVMGGTAAQVAAWRAYQESPAGSVRDHAYMVKTKDYNGVDVRVMAEVVAYFRRQG